MDIVFIINLIKTITENIVLLVGRFGEVGMEKINDFINVCSPFLTSLIDERINIYIGITGLLVAIVIFIAEIISSKKNELYKKLILKKTQIIDNVRDMIIILAMMWASELIDDDIKIIYEINNLLINISIVISMYNTFKMFKIAINLNMNEEYLNEQLDLYVYEEIEKFQKIQNEIRNKKSDLKEEFNNYIQNSKVFSYNSNFFDLNQTYKGLYLDENGFIKNYKYSLLNDIEKSTALSVKNNNFLIESKIESSTPNKAEIILCKNVGDKIDKRFPIAYYKNLDKVTENKLKQIIVFDTKEVYSSQNVIKIIENLFKIAKEDKSNFDNSKQLLKFYEFLYKGQYNDAEIMFIKQLEKIYFEAINNSEYNKSFSRFLVRLLGISRKVDKYEDFSVINSYITNLYCCRMKTKNVDFKKIAYQYANNVFIGNYYSIKRLDDCKYYDNMMANLLSLINEFVKKKRVDAVNVLFDNIHFEEIRDRIDSNLNEKEILKFQFLIGIIHIILCSYKLLDEKNLKEIKLLIGKIKYKFINIIDMWDVILCFKKYKEHDSEIKKETDSIDVHSEDHTYKNSWSWWSLDEKQILKCLLYMLNINFVDLEGINENDIDRNDAHYFENIKNILEDRKYEKLENVFLYEKYNISRLNKVLEKAIEISNKKEEEYKIIGLLDEDKVDKFKELLIKNSKKMTGIYKFIFDLNKVKESNKKIKKVFGFNQLIPRDIFFKDMGGMEAIASDYGDAFPRGINEHIIEEIEKRCEVTKDSLETILKSIENLNDYIVITNFIDFHRTALDKDGNYFMIDNCKVEVLKTNDTDNMIIVDKKTLPIIEFCEFDDSYDANYIEDKMFYKLDDCSKNQILINEIVEKTEWIKEEWEDETERNNHMKQQCRLQAYISYQIVDTENIKGYIINNEEDSI